MKRIYILMILTFPVLATLAVMTGCEYDVAEPLWEKTTLQNPSNGPSISSITPGEAVPGINTITINGTHLDMVANDRVFLDDVGNIVIQPEVISITPTSITIRRPNFETNGCMIKLNPDSGAVVKFGPYKISPVIKEYGSFKDNNPLSCLTVDKAENVYGALTMPVQPDGRTPFTIYKLTPDENRRTLITLPVIAGLPAIVPTDMKVGPGGYLYLFRNHKVIQRIDTSTGEIFSWFSISGSKKAMFGDFDASGYLYTGGPKSDLWIIGQDSTGKSSGIYDKDSIFAITVANNYLYVASKTGNTKYAIYRHTILSGGDIGVQETVLDLTATAYAEERVRSLSISEDGTMFIGLLNVDPMLVVSPDGQIDVFYKGIIPLYVDHAAYGTGSLLYVISGNTTPSQPWKVFRVDTGKKAALKQ